VWTQPHLARTPRAADLVTTLRIKVKRDGTGAFRFRDRQSPYRRIPWMDGSVLAAAEQVKKIDAPARRPPARRTSGTSPINFKLDQGQ
jgi:hypothetical protein